MRVTEVLEEAAHLNVEVGDQLVAYGLAVHQLQSVEGRTAKEVLQYIYDHVEVLPDAARFSARSPIQSILCDANHHAI